MLRGSYFKGAEAVSHFCLCGYGEQDQALPGKAQEDERLTDIELRQKISSVDKKRSRYYEAYTGHSWGDRLNYDLRINTMQTVIKEIVPVLAKLF